MPRPAPIAEPNASLDALRRRLAALDPALAPGFGGAAGEPLRLGVAAIDRVLGQGLPRGALHELAPAAAADLAAATGFALALAARSQVSRGTVLWIATGFASAEGGEPYAPGLDLLGVSSARLLTLSVPRPLDALWAMEEALRCRALAAVVAELPGGASVGLTQTRRLALAARDGAGFGLLLRHRASAEPNAAATRWRIAAHPSRPDRFGGLGPPAFGVSLVKNRLGPAGRWCVTWDRHEHVFREALSLGVAEAAFDRPDRTPARRAG